MAREWWATIIMVCVVWGSVWTGSHRDGFYFFDVGQGDSALIVTQGVRILIDAGKGGHILSELEAVIPFWTKRIDIIIITHPEQDHIGGVFEVVNHYDVGVVAHTNRTNAMWDQLHRLLDEKNIPTIELSQGDKITIGDHTMRVIWPPIGIETDNENDASLVIKMTTPCTSVLYTGDIGLNQEKSIVERYIVDTDVIKIPHHGSKFSSGASLIEAVSPLVSVISVGNNSYGHPTPEVIQRLQTANSTLWRTDKDGSLKMVCREGLLHLESLSSP